MRIKQLTNVPRTNFGPAPLEEKKSSGGFQQSFQRHMSQVNTAEYEKYLRDLSDKIKQQGDMISEKMDLAEFQKYRELIMELFRETASNSYMYLKADKFDARGRHKIFAVIKKVNDRLDELAAQVLADQADNLQTLHLVDDIRGLLVDLFI